VAVYFADNILQKRLPAKHMIERFLTEDQLDRKWTNVKDFIRNDLLIFVIMF